MNSTSLGSDLNHFTHLPSYLTNPWRECEFARFWVCGRQHGKREEKAI
jgi:hypothetical protein